MTLGINSDEIRKLINLYKLGDLDNAENEAKLLIEQYPNSFILLNIFGAILSSQKKYNKAIIKFKESIKINPNYAQAENNLGIAYQNLNEYNKSISCYSRAIKLKPDFAEAHNNFGVLLKNLGKFKEAIVHFKDALKIQTDYKVAREALGSTLLHLGKYIEGLEMISQGTGFIRFNNKKKIEIINTLKNEKN